MEASRINSTLSSDQTCRTKGMSALEPDSIHNDFTLQSSSYKTGSIHFDRVRTTNLTRYDRAQFPLYVHVIGRAFFNKSISSAEMLFGCFLVRCYVFAKKRTTKTFGVGTLDHKESRKETEAASGREKVAKVRIVVSINMRSVRDEQCVRLFLTPRSTRHFEQPRSSNKANCHVIISFPVKIHFRSRSNPPTRSGLPRSRSDPHKSTHAKTHTSADRIDLDPIAIQSRLKC